LLFIRAWMGRNCPSGVEPHIHNAITQRCIIKVIRVPGGVNVTVWVAIVLCELRGTSCATNFNVLKLGEGGLHHQMLINAHFQKFVQQCPAWRCNRTVCILCRVGLLDAAL
jgi:hypothetical protein